MPHWISAVVSTAVLLLAESASAATLNVVGGQLVGASGVEIGGTLYDVEFVEGTCTDLFSGCDAISDFTFEAEADAEAASQALLDQVFADGALGSFDTDPEATSGCEDSQLCRVFTPYAPYSAVQTYLEAAINGDGVNFADATQGFVITNTSDTSGNPIGVYASWSAVPEPADALLLATGLLGLAVRRGSH
jgi:hypothetical protein